MLRIWNVQGTGAEQEHWKESSILKVKAIPIWRLGNINRKYTRPPSQIESSRANMNTYNGKICNGPLAWLARLGSRKQLVFYWWRVFTLELAEPRDAYKERAVPARYRTCSRAW